MWIRTKASQTKFVFVDLRMSVFWGGGGGRMGIPISPEKSLTKITTTTYAYPTGERLGVLFI
jgi:hypothetical protein